VLAPVAVLGLMGVGYGAFAYGQAPEPAPLPPTTTQGSAPPPEPPKAVPAAVWAKRAEAVCATKDAELRRDIGEIQIPADAEALLVKLLEVYREFEPSLAELGWPKGKKAAVVALRAELKKAFTLTSAALEAARTGDLVKLEGLTPELEATEERVRTSLIQLGAERCLEGSKESKRPKPKFDSPESALATALDRYRVAVLVFYTPKAQVDTTVVREARAAAIDTKAGFVTVNAAQNKQVAALAQTYGIRETPAVLVFVRGPRVVSQFGLVDRTTVAQAVVNARR
jgi:hypothetical protein